MTGFSSSSAIGLRVAGRGSDQVRHAGNELCQRTKIDRLASPKNLSKSALDCSEAHKHFGIFGRERRRPVGDVLLEFHRDAAESDHHDRAEWWRRRWRR
jgi:hypothetical protein